MEQKKEYVITSKYATQKPLAALHSDGYLVWNTDNFTVFSSILAAKRAIKKTVKRNGLFFNLDSFTIEERN